MKIAKRNMYASHSLMLGKKLTANRNYKQTAKNNVAKTAKKQFEIIYLIDFAKRSIDI